MSIFTLDPFEHPFPADVRPAFNAHVASPLIHYAVAERLDEFRAWYTHVGEAAMVGFLQTEDQDITQVQVQSENASQDVGANPSGLRTAHRIIQILTNRTTHEGLFKDVEPLRGGKLAPGMLKTLSIPQRTAFRQFTVPAGVGSWGQGYATTILRTDGITLSRSLEEVDKRHPEMRLREPRTLIDFMRKPELPGILRGVMMGGNGFFASLITQAGEGHSALEEWRRRDQRPLAIMEQSSNDRMRLHPAVVATAKSHRRLVENEGPRESVGSDKVAPSHEYSSGCPMRHTTFKTGVESLTEHGLQLTDRQLNYLTRQRKGVAMQHPERSDLYIIKRDGIKDLVLITAEILERITDILDKPKLHANV